jgi:hypothetical protein
LAVRRQTLGRLQQRLRHTRRLIEAADVGKTRWLLREDRLCLVKSPFLLQ